MRLAAICLLLAALPACAASSPDLVLLNARVFTADPARPWAEALAIRGERIVAVGTTEEVRALAGFASARDLGGRVVLPGLNDAHVDDPGGDVQATAAFTREALAAGVTSMQWFAGGRPVRELGQVLVASAVPARVRVLRMPRPGPDGDTLDSRPHLPPQPAPRIDIRGMGFRIDAPTSSQVSQAVKWAYGTEDLLALEPSNDAVLEAYLSAVEHTGTPEVWSRKRPRVERATSGAVAWRARLRAQGMVVVQRRGAEDVPLRTLVDEGVPLALATGTGRDAWDTVAWATSPERGHEALTVEQALTAFSRGASYAELADRDKGHLTVGALADLTVASIDPFTAGPQSLRGVRSVLTLISGQVVHDVP